MLEQAILLREFFHYGAVKYKPLEEELKFGNKQRPKTHKKP